MDFLEVRKEINAEIKKRSDLKTSESHANVPKKANKSNQRAGTPAISENKVNRMANKFIIDTNLSGNSTLNMGSNHRKSQSPS